MAGPSKIRGAFKKAAHPIRALQSRFAKPKAQAPSQQINIINVTTTNASRGPSAARIAITRQSVRSPIKGMKAPAGSVIRQLPGIKQLRAAQMKIANKVKGAVAGVVKRAGPKM
jgi:hypothetical protein